MGGWGALWALRANSNEVDRKSPIVPEPPLDAQSKPPPLQKVSHGFD